jgi:cell division protein FtsZ
LEGLIETIYNTGVINIDFADLHAILVGNGKMAFLNTVYFKKGEESDLDSFDKVFASPLYPYTIDKARGLLLNIVAQKDLKLLEVNKILTSIAGRIHKDARIIFGVSHEGADAGTVKVTVLATGCIYAGVSNTEDNGKEVVLPPAPSRTAPPAPPPKTSKAKKTGKSQKKRAGAAGSEAASVKKNNQAKNKKGGKLAENEKNGVKKPIIIKVQTAPAGKEIKNPRTGQPLPPVAGDANIYQNQQSINAQFEAPVRKNALQVKKEIEREEKEMLEKEKAWEVPAFLRKQKK